MRTRTSPRNQDALWRSLGMDLARHGARANAEALAALRLCLQEIEQAHRHHYPDCPGFCPAHEAMAAARKVLGAS